MPDDYIEPNIGCGRIGCGGCVNSILGVIIGLALVAVSFVVLFWNEGRAVMDAKTLAQARTMVRPAPCNVVIPSANGQLIYTVGTATCVGLLADPMFHVNVHAIRLRRQVTVYQWNEDVKETGHYREYHYERVWSESVSDWHTFRHPEGHRNTRPSYSSKDFTTPRVTIGVFGLSDDLTEQLNDYAPLPLAKAAGRTPHTLPPSLVEHGGRLDPDDQTGSVKEASFYIGADPHHPQIGDVRVKFKAVLPQTVSVIAEQQGRKLVAGHTPNGGAMCLLYPGRHTAAGMFRLKQQSNTLETWGLRAAGLVLMVIGFLFMSAPLTSLLDAIPLVGGIVEFGGCLTALILATILSIITVAVGWLYYRPIAAGVALGVAVGLLVMLARHGRARSARRRAAG